MLGTGPGRELTFSVHGVHAWNKPPQQTMVRSKRWKFNWYPQAESERDQYVLYDMENDPEEITNLAGQPEHKTVVKEHLDAIHDFLARLKECEHPPLHMSGGKGKGKGKGQRNFRREV